MSTGYRTADRIALLLSIVILFMLNIQTINCMQYTELVVTQSRSQSRNEINTHTEHLVQKHNNFLWLKRSYLVLDEEKKNKETRMKS